MYIREYQDTGIFSGGCPLPQEPGVDQSPVTFTGTHGESAAFKSNTKLVRIHVDGIASILFSAAGTAATANTNLRMTAGQTSDFLVQPGTTLKVSAVTST